MTNSNLMVRQPAVARLGLNTDSPCLFPQLLRRHPREKPGLGGKVVALFAHHNSRQVEPLLQGGRVFQMPRKSQEYYSPPLLSQEVGQPAKASPSILSNRNIMQWALIERLLNALSINSFHLRSGCDSCPHFIEDK